MALTFLAAALKASLCEMSGLPALMRWISSLQIPFPQKNQSKENKRKRKQNVRSSSSSSNDDDTPIICAITIASFAIHVSLS